MISIRPTLLLCTALVYSWMASAIASVAWVQAGTKLLNVRLLERITFTDAGEMIVIGASGKVLEKSKIGDDQVESLRKQLAVTGWVTLRAIPSESIRAFVRFDTLAT